MKSFKPEEVFTPAAPAVGSVVYAKRKNSAITFSETLNEKGSQVLVYGDSAIGKTSFVLTELRNKMIPHIRVQCNSKMTSKQISNELLRELKEGIEQKEIRKASISPELSVNVYLAKAKLGGESSDEIEKTLGGQMGSVQHITEILCTKKISLVVDDFEKAKDDYTKVFIANLAKNLSDRATSGKSARVIVVGISDTAEHLINADLSIDSRLMALYIPRMSDEEMEEILRVGFNKLRIKEEDGIIMSLASSFGGFPKYAHAIGLEVSRAVLAAGEKTIKTDAVARGMRAFLRRYCRSVKSRYEKATVVRCKPNQDYILVAKGLLELGRSNDFTLEEAKSAIEDYIRGQMYGEATYSMDNKKLRTLLGRLCKAERGSLFSKSSITGRYRYTDPLSPIFLNLGQYIPQE